MDDIAPFARRYATARAGFLAEATAAGLAIESHPHPLPGRDGEVLALDVARDGPAEAERVLLISSGCHGVEGYCGSGVQRAVLAAAALRQQAKRAGVALVFVHALNPHGFSWCRRTTHENIDLNRNFQDFTQPLPHHAAYDDLAALLLPEAWPPEAGNVQAIGEFIARRGQAAFQAAVSGGQYHHPDGLFFGGLGPCWSHLVLRQVLRRHGQAARHIGWIDLHTGLGPSGVGEKILAALDDTTLARARQWWGAAVTALHDGSSSSAPLTGLMWQALPQECPQAQVTGIALEFGTLPILDMLQALRAEAWARRHPEAPATLHEAIRAQVFAAFFVDTPEWRAAILAQGLQAVGQALDGLVRA